MNVVSVFYFLIDFLTIRTTILNQISNKEINICSLYAAIRFSAYDKIFSIDTKIKTSLNI